MGGDLGSGLLRLDSVLEALSGGRARVMDACWITEFGRSRSSCGGIDRRLNVDMIELLDLRVSTAGRTEIPKSIPSEFSVPACAVTSEPVKGGRLESSV